MNLFLNQMASIQVAFLMPSGLVKWRKVAYTKTGINAALNGKCLWGLEIKSALILLGRFWRCEVWLKSFRSTWEISWRRDGELYYLLNNMSFTGCLTGKHFVSPIKHIQFTDMFIRIQKQTHIKAIKVIAVMGGKSWLVVVINNTLVFMPLFHLKGI